MNAPDLGVITPSNAGLVVSDRIAELEAALAAERERREAADKILRDIRNRGVGGWVTSAIDAHFARYEKD